MLSYVLSSPFHVTQQSPSALYIALNDNHLACSYNLILNIFLHFPNAFCKWLKKKKINIKYNLFSNQATSELFLTAEVFTKFP